MFSLLADLQKERGFPHPSRKKKLLKLKRESTRFFISCFIPISTQHPVGSVKSVAASFFVDNSC